MTQAPPRQRKLFPWGYIAPLLLLEAGFVFTPLLLAAAVSFQNYDYFRPGGWVGFDNYAWALGNPEFLKAVVATTIFTVFATGLTFFAGFGLAMLFERDNRHSVLMRTVVLIPYFISMLVGSLLLRWVFSEDAGLATLAFKALGITPFSILAEPRSAMVALVANAIWRDSAFAMILLLAGLKSIPPSLLNAARVDGASYFYAFRRIVIPLMRVPILITLVRLTLFYMNVLTFPLILTGGGPGGATETVVLWMYRRGFEDYAIGKANAIALLVLVVNVILVVSLMLLFRRRRAAAA
ncbi:MAG: sugar ABC transporter permease [Burkholderiaceae bacterium]|nr:sugar ABC transporter permease [Burkholderiaceae bacterium]